MQYDIFGISVVDLRIFRVPGFEGDILTKENLDDKIQPPGHCFSLSRRLMV
jgi:hypothetical protein